MKNNFLNIELTNVICNGKEEDIILKIKNKKNGSNLFLIINNKTGENKDIKICLYADNENFEIWENVEGVEI
ncbi:hypothetical protein [Klebsiella pneumoniae]|uniref:hypothetical protein n=1 Tax=Klebsiella pneumoniae TaxID=573 RepID=UPI0011DD0ACF|nr:hypothetical protein [Klebsiella pneumoniae]TXW25857.1 hypothetical protein D4M53_27695 [Klebsiella pneumoniae]